MGTKNIGIWTNTLGCEQSGAREMGLLQDIDADKIITPERNFWEMISSDISLVCALMTET